MSVMSFRLINFRSAVKQGRITKADEIQTLAEAIDEDLMAWERVLPSHWRVGDPASPRNGQGFEHRQLRYPSTWYAEIWNTWRILRIACNVIIFEHGNAVAEAVRVIQTMSEEVCCSVSCFENSTRKSWPCFDTPFPVLCEVQAGHQHSRGLAGPMIRGATADCLILGAMSLIRHLIVISVEAANTVPTREFAARELRRIGERMGMKHAADTAKLIIEHLEDRSKTGGFESLDCDTLPLTASF